MKNTRKKLGLAGILALAFASGCATPKYYDPIYKARQIQEQREKERIERKKYHPLIEFGAWVGVSIADHKY